MIKFCPNNKLKAIILPIEPTLKKEDISYSSK